MKHTVFSLQTSCVLSNTDMYVTGAPSHTTDPSQLVSRASLSPPSTHLSHLSPLYPLLYLPLSVTHQPSRPPSRTSCPPWHRLHSTPLSPVVWALIASEKSKKHHTHRPAQPHTHTCMYRPLHTPFNQHTQYTTTVSRSLPFSLRPRPVRLPGSWPQRATQLHFLLLFFPFLWFCFSPTFWTCSVTRPEAIRTTFTPTPTPAFYLHSA